MDPSATSSNRSSLRAARTLLILVGALALTACRPAAAEVEAPQSTPIPPSGDPMAQAEPASPRIDHTVTTIDGSTVSLSDYRGTALLIVNTASECGYTRQLAGLQDLHARYAERGFAVLGFPCNDFGGQEPGSSEQIAAFCSGQFGVTFPLFDKVHARGDEQHPLYRTLTEETAEGVRGPVRWNFTKFLVDAEGAVVARFEPSVEPLADELIAAVEAVLPR
jgi:glutathione peroxidase